jgi:hypothetical protein
MIKKVTTIAAVFLLVTPAQASWLRDNKDTFCPILRRVAMEYRQSDRSVTEALQVTNAMIDKFYQSTSHQVVASMQDLSQGYVREAYRSVVFSTRSYKDQAVNQFANDKEAQCFDILSRPASRR